MQMPIQCVALMIMFLNVAIAAEGPKRHVVLICGDSAENGQNEFWCDTARMYDAFRATGVADGDIHVLYGDGEDWTCSRNSAHNHKSSITDNAATVANVSATFNTLAAAVGRDDTLIVWTFDHGASDGALGLMGEYMSPDTFAGLVKPIKCRAKVFLMQQCYSGKMIVPITSGSPNTVVLTAARNEPAYRADDVDWENNNPCWTGEFNYYLINAIERKSPTGASVSVCDLNGDGHTSCIEAWYNVCSKDGQPNPGGEGTLNECAGMSTRSTPQYISANSALDNVKLTGN